MNGEERINQQPDWETCVVCGNAVEPGRGAARINHRGNTVNLCGPACQQAFAREPDPYLAQLAKRMRERAMHDSLNSDGVRADRDEEVHAAPLFQVIGAKTDLRPLLPKPSSAIKCVSIALLFSSLLIASTTSTLGANIGGSQTGTPTNLLSGNATNAASAFTAPQINHEDCCAIVSSNILMLAVVCCAQTDALQGGIGLRADGLTKATSGAVADKTITFFDGAIINVGGSGQHSERLQREGDTSSRLRGPDAAREPRGLRIFNWRW